MSSYLTNWAVLRQHRVIAHWRVSWHRRRIGVVLIRCTSFQFDLWRFVCLWKWLWCSRTLRTPWRHHHEMRGRCRSFSLFVTVAVVVFSYEWAVAFPHVAHDIGVAHNTMSADDELGLWVPLMISYVKSRLQPNPLATFRQKSIKARSSFALRHH